MTELAVIAQTADLPTLFGKRENGKPTIEIIIEKIEQDARSVVFDINTKAGQATCRSLAAKIASAKVALDKAGKTTKDEYTVFTKQIDDDRRLARERLQALQEEIRKPLTELEEAEKARKAHHEANIANKLALVGVELELLDSKAIHEQITKLQDTVIGDDWEEYKTQALETKDATLAKLRNLFDIVKNREDEQAELERLRAERAEQERREREAQIAREAEQRALAQAEAQAKAEREKAEREAREAKEREARLIAEKEAAELRAKQEAELAVQRERERIEAEKAKAEAERLERERNKAHRNKILLDARQGFIDAGFDKQTAGNIVKLIVAGVIPNVTINF